MKACTAATALVAVLIVVPASGLRISTPRRFRSPSHHGSSRRPRARAGARFVTVDPTAVDPTDEVDCKSQPEECDWECTEDARCEVKPVPAGRSRDRLVVRFDEEWVDLTGWRKAHPAGSHWIDLYKNNDATEVMHAFHSDSAQEMLARLPRAKAADIPTGAAAPAAPNASTRAFRELRTKLIREGWFKRKLLPEAGTLAGWVATMALAVAASNTGHPLVAAILLAVSNTSAGWISHDYVHGRGRWAKLMRGFGMVGGGMSTTWWSDKHNLHHALTNVVGVDEDLMVDPVLYLWPPAPENDNKARRFQHLYWFLPYSLLFAIWRVDSVKVAWKRKLWGELGGLALHYAVMAKLFSWSVAVPALFLSGLLTATIVTVSHVNDDLYFGGPHEAQYVESQFRSTRDFECSNPVFEYVAGGMNYQLEHHLFPTMPRYYYPKLVPIIKQFAKDNNLEYRVDSDWSIFKRTIATLKRVGQSPAAEGALASRNDDILVPAAQRG